MMNPTFTHKLSHLRKMRLLFSSLLLILPILGWISGVDLIGSGIIGWPVLALFVMAFGRGFELGSRRSGITLCILGIGPTVVLMSQILQPGTINPIALSLYVIASVVGGYLSLVCVKHLRTSE